MSCEKVVFLGFSSNTSLSAIFHLGTIAKHLIEPSIVTIVYLFNLSQLCVIVNCCLLLNLVAAHPHQFIHIFGSKHVEKTTP